MSDRKGVSVLLLVGVAVAIAAFFIATAGGDPAGGLGTGGPSGGADQAGAPAPTIEQEVELGAVDLGEYCAFFGYEGHRGRSCIARIASPGGIKDKDGYCEKTLKLKGASAAFLEGRWVCERLIDTGKACDWQYRDHGLKGRETDGKWTCAR